MRRNGLWVGWTMMLAAMVVSCQPTEDDLSTKVFDQVDEMPEFPGGADSLKAYITKHVRYPQSARMDSVSGTVLVEFIVTQLGQVDSIRIKESLHPDCDSIAKDAIERMPAWNAGELDGLPVNVRLLLPIQFNLRLE